MYQKIRAPFFQHTLIIKYDVALLLILVGQKLLNKDEKGLIRRNMFKKTFRTFILDSLHPDFTHLNQ